MIKSVMLVCLGNICRSPYAEVKLKELNKLYKKNISKISSSGIIAMVGESANINSIKIAKECGLDLSKHIATQITINLLKEHDLILVMDDEQKNTLEKKYPFSLGKIHCIGKWRNEEIQDPYGKPYPAYVFMAKHIDDCLNDWVVKIK